MRVVKFPVSGVTNSSSDFTPGETLRLCRRNHVIFHPRRTEEPFLDSPLLNFNFRESPLFFLPFFSLSYLLVLFLGTDYLSFPFSPVRSFRHRSASPPHRNRTVGSSFSSRNTPPTSPFPLFISRQSRVHRAVFGHSSSSYPPQASSFFFRKEVPPEWVTSSIVKGVTFLTIPNAHKKRAPMSRAYLSFYQYVAYPFLYLFSLPLSAVCSQFCAIFNH